MRSNTLTVILIVLMALPAAAQKGRRLTWERVDGAAGYYIEIRDSGGTITAAETVRENFYDISNLQPGDYSFRIATVNILQQRGESTEWIDFSIEKLFLPELHSVSRMELIASHSNKNIIVKGKNFKPQSRFLLRKNGEEIPLEDADLRSENEVSISFKPSSSMTGRYDLVVVNRGDAEAVLKGAIDIVEPEKAETVFYAGAHYSVNVPMGAFPEYFAASFYGGGLFIQASALRFGFENIFIEGEIDAARYVNTDDSRKCSLTYYTFGAGLDYIYPVEAAPVELVFKILAGPVYTVLVLDEKFTGKKNTSVDFFAMLGAGVRYYPGTEFFIEPGFGWKTVFYAGTYLHDIKVSIGCGVRL